MTAQVCCIGLSSIGCVLAAQLWAPQTPHSTLQQVKLVMLECNLHADLAAVSRHRWSQR